MHNWLIAILTLLFSIPTLAAQELEWSVDASMLINNREGGEDKNFTPDETHHVHASSPRGGRLAA